MSNNGHVRDSNPATFTKERICFYEMVYFSLFHYYEVHVMFDALIHRNYLLLKIESLSPANFHNTPQGGFFRIPYTN